jgi:hypothetical protein
VRVRKKPDATVPAKAGIQVLSAAGKKNPAAFAGVTSGVRRNDGLSMFSHKKTPSGVFHSADSRILLLGAAGTDDFDFHAAVLGAAGCGLVVGDRLLLALAFGVDAVRFHALALQVGLDGFGAADDSFWL